MQSAIVVGMPTITVKRSVLIDAPQEQVFDTLRDFTTWPIWSPWIITEPETKLSYSDDGKSYSWEGEFVGSGNLQLESENRPTAINSQLNFIKPFKSKASTRFKVDKKTENQTQVTWEMDSSLPIFFFFMTKMFAAIIGMDYQRGLTMLKGYIEDGMVPSKLDFNQIDSPQLGLVGIQKTCSIDDMGCLMTECLEKLAEIEGKGKGISIYHKWDVVNHQVTFTTGYLVDREPAANQSLPKGSAFATIPATPAFTVTHTGPYKHLGNGWAAGINRGRNKVYKQNKRIHPFEIYQNSPAEVTENELKTTIHFPMKPKS